YFYCPYGLRLRSAIALPGLTNGPESDFDADIALGSVPPSLPGAVDIGLRYQSARGRFLITVDGVARFLVADGERILIDLHPGADEAAVRLFLLGPALGA